MARKNKLDDHPTVVQVRQRDRAAALWGSRSRPELVTCSDRVPSDGHDQWLCRCDCCI
jgi:hypothetical protein